MPGQALAQDDLAPLIHAHRVKHALCNVDSEYAHLWFHWTRLLWLYGFTDRALIVAHCSRSAQGRVHFITTHYPLSRGTRPGGKGSTRFCLYTIHLCSIIVGVRRATRVVMSPYSRGVAPCPTMRWPAMEPSVGVN